jgi:hypothetical protein
MGLGTLRSIMSAQPDSIQRTVFELAIHEAAHASVASLLNAPVHAVAIRTRTDQSGLDGEALINFANVSDRDALAITFAGVAADAAFGHPGDDDTDDRDGSDTARLKEIAGRFGRAAEREFFAATRRAEKFVVILAYEISTLARALAATPFVGGVATIVGEDLAPFLPGPRFSPWVKNGH